MRQEYESLFHKDSMPIFNVSDDLRIQNYSGDSSTITVVYAGSLYYGRYNLVCEVAKCISKLNKNNDTNLYLEIYAGQDVSNEVKAQLTIKGASVFGGALNKPDLIRKLNEADYPRVELRQTVWHSVDHIRLSINVQRIKQAIP